jgi:hypothetical protein
LTFDFLALGFAALTANPSLLIVAIYSSKVMFIVSMIARGQQSGIPSVSMPLTTSFGGRHRRRKEERGGRPDSDDEGEEDEEGEDETPFLRW